MTPIYNPLDKIHLGENVRDALLRQPVVAMPPSQRFAGAGIYALYCTGDFAAYEKLVERNRRGCFEAPIYVGEAVPEGSRKGGLLAQQKPTSKLYSRLREHAKSIGQTTNLRIEDFHFRCLVVDDIWIPLGEALMIDTFAPVWNKLIDGFGIHTPGKNRPQTMSAWDVLHPGRAFVTKAKLLSNPKSHTDLIEEVRRHLALPRVKQSRVPTVEEGR